MKYLFVAHSRSGTAYAAALLLHLGWDVGHEQLGPDGIVCWAWGAPARHACFSPGPRPPLKDFEHCVHLIRNPLDCIGSVAFTENSPTAWAYRRQFCPNLREWDPTRQIGCAAESWLEWNRLILLQKFKGPVQVERLKDYLEGKPGVVRRGSPPSTELNARPGSRRVTWEEIAAEAGVFTEAKVYALGVLAGYFDPEKSWPAKGKAETPGGPAKREAGSE